MGARTMSAAALTAAPSKPSTYCAHCTFVPGSRSRYVPTEDSRDCKCACHGESQQVAVELGLDALPGKDARAEMTTPPVTAADGAGGPFRPDLDALLANGGHVDVIRRALDALHAGDDAVKWLVMLSCLSAASVDRIHDFLAGGSRQGKSHVLERVGEALFEGRFLRYDGASPKVLFYEADKDPKFLAGKIVFLDEIADREHMWPILKKIADSNSDRLEHHTVLERKPVIFVLEGLPVILTAGAKDIPDEQINGRFLKLSVDETKEQTALVLDFIAVAAAGQGDSLRNEDVVKAAEILNIIMEGGPFRVLIPEAEALDFSAFAMAQPRVDATLFLKIVKAQALLNRHRRPTFWHADGTTIIVAVEADIEEAFRLWRAIGPTRDIKLDSSAFAVLEVVPYSGDGKGPMSPTRDIKTALVGKLAPSTVAKKLDALYERGLVDQEQGERYNILYWGRLLTDAELARMKDGSGPVSTLDSPSFSVPWKAPVFESSTSRERHVERWAVSTLSTVSTGSESTDAKRLAEVVVGVGQS